MRPQHIFDSDVMLDESHGIRGFVPILSQIGDCDSRQRGTAGSPWLSIAAGSFGTAKARYTKFTFVPCFLMPVQDSLRIREDFHDVAALFPCSLQPFELIPLS
ncbi:UNVERIFIED_CONTAM: hypothetical protein K2H54_066491 [Gekko kuhli]